MRLTPLPANSSNRSWLWLMVLAALFFSLMTLFVRLAGHTLPSQQIVLVRSIVTLAYSYFAVRYVGVPLWGRHYGWLLLRGLFGFGALSCLYYAVTRLPLAEANVLQYTNPVFTALLAAAFLQERMGRWEVVGTVVSLMGVVTIARPSSLFGSSVVPLDPFAVGIALLGALCSASAYVIVRHLRGEEHPMVIIFYFPLVSTLLSLPTAASPAFEWPRPYEWLLLVVGVSVSGQLGQIFLTKGLHAERAGRAMGISYLQVLFAALWGVLFLDEAPSPLTVIGALLVLGGTLITARQPAVAPVAPE